MYLNAGEWPYLKRLGSVALLNEVGVDFEVSKTQVRSNASLSLPVAYGSKNRTLWQHVCLDATKLPTMMME